MFSSIGELIALLLGVVPGYLAVRGYGRRAYRTTPERDLYALVTALLISALWLGLVYLLLRASGNPLRDWGLADEGGLKWETVKDNLTPIILVSAAVLTTPYLLGVGAALGLDWIERRPHEGFWKMIRKTGLYRPPVAWDLAWLRSRRRRNVEVVVTMKSGLIIRGAFGSKSRADLSPAPPGLFLETGYGLILYDDGKREQLQAQGSRGIFINAEEIEVIYFRDRQPLELPAQSADEGADTTASNQIPLPAEIES